jgi:hypothetical protein
MLAGVESVLARSVTAMGPVCCEYTLSAVAVQPFGTHVNTEYGAVGVPCSPVNEAVLVLLTE